MKDSLALKESSLHRTTPAPPRNIQRVIDLKLMRSLFYKSRDVEYSRKIVSVNVAGAAERQSPSVGSNP